MKTTKKHRKSKISSRSLSVLLAEDDPEMRKLLSWSLERRGYRVVECTDGITLMRKLGLLGPADQVQPHDLIISDIRMPGVTGLQVLENAREFSDFPPMILITAFPDTESRNQAARLGAVAMMAKPFDIEELLDKVEETVPLGTPKPRRDQHKGDGHPPFPFDVTLRHESGSQAVRDYIQGVAAKLSPFAEHVANGRMVIDQADTDQHKKHRYSVTLVLSTSGSPIVVKYDTDRGTSSDDLYMAINVVFGTALRRLKESIERRQEH